MADVECEIDTSAFEAELARLDERLMTELGEAVDRTCKNVAKDARAQHSFTNRTRNLEESIVGQLWYVIGQHAEGSVFPVESYGGFVEFGTTRSKPYPFLTPLIEAGEPGLESEIGQAFAIMQSILDG